MHVAWTTILIKKYIARDLHKLATQLEMSEQAPFSVILVTGGCGFVPSNFINNLLHSSNTKVVNYDRLTPAGNKANVISSLAAPKQYRFSSVATSATALCSIEYFDVTTLTWWRTLRLKPTSAIPTKIPKNL